MECLDVDMRCAYKPHTHMKHVYPHHTRASSMYTPHPHTVTDHGHGGATSAAHHPLEFYTHSTTADTNNSIQAAATQIRTSHYLDVMFKGMEGVLVWVLRCMSGCVFVVFYLFCACRCQHYLLFMYFLGCLLVHERLGNNIITTMYEKHPLPSHFLQHGPCSTSVPTHCITAQHSTAAQHSSNA